MNIGYARVSTLNQNLDLQLQALRKAGCIKNFREKVSGASGARPEFQRGIHLGRPRKLNRELTKLARRLIDEGQSIRKIAGTFNVHTATIYRLSHTAT